MGIGAITVDASNRTAGGSTNPLTWTHTCSGANSYLLVSIGTNGFAATQATYAGVNMTKVGSAQENTTGYRVSLWELIAPASGANTVSASLSAAAAYSCMSLSFNGVHQTVPSGGAGIDTASSTISESLTISSTIGDVVVDAIVWNQLSFPSTENAGSQQTEQGGAATGNFVRCAMSTESGSATVTMSWNFTSATNLTHVGISLNPISIDSLIAMKTLALTGCGM